MQRRIDSVQIESKKLFTRTLNFLAASTEREKTFVKLLF